MEKFDLGNLENMYEKGLDKRFTIDGVTKTYSSYKLPIASLYYNDLNGRIASCIEEYNDTHDDNVSVLKESDIEKYNDILADYIVDSAVDNGDSFNKTKEDIRAKGQQIPGVVLTDGRIIDGNRRFTALRKLYKETGDPRFYYFEAVCLKAPSEGDKDGWKKIKSLELNLQFNVDNRKDYNRIDELVSFYRDVMDDSTKMFDEKSYCFASGLKKGKFNDNKRVVNIMLDYLDWRGKPKAFYILKNEKLDGPIEDIAKATAKMNPEEWNSKKDVIYQYMTIMDEGDRTRNIRDLLKSAKADGQLYQHVSKNMESNAAKIISYMSSVDKKAETAQETTDRNELKKSLSNGIKDAYSDGRYFESETNASIEPAKNIEKAIKALTDIDIPSIKQLSDEDKKDLADKINLLKTKIKELEDAE